MPNYFNLTLDTTAPSTPSILIDGGATYTSTPLVDCTISTGDGTTTGYQMKIWGDVDLTWGISNGVIKSGSTTTLEADAEWITYSTSKQIQLTSGDATKTLYLKVRDDVNNESSQASDTIIVDSSIPVVNITGPDVSKISKIAGKNVSSFNFSCDSDFVEYKVKVVSAIGATHDTGILIGTANGSTNMSGTGSFTAGTPISSSINGSDLELASSGDGEKIIKVFCMDTGGNWST